MLSLSDILHSGETVVVHCNTRDEAVEFIRLARDEVGLKRTDISARVAWNSYKNKVCFRLTPVDHEIGYGFGDIELYRGDGYVIHEASLFLRTVPESNIELLVVEDISIEGLF